MFEKQLHEITELYGKLLKDFVLRGGDLAKAEQKILALESHVDELKSELQDTIDSFNQLSKNYTIRGEALVKAEERVRQLNLRLAVKDEIYIERARMVMEFLRGKIDSLSTEALHQLDLDR